MPEPTGAIHDIGYRHYDGPRLGAAYIRRSLYVDTLRGAFGLGRSARSKVMPFLLLAVMVLPAITMGIVTGYFGLPALPLGYTEYFFAFQVVVTIFVGSQAPAAMSRDLRFRVAPLYFSRPLSRAAVRPGQVRRDGDRAVHPDGAADHAAVRRRAARGAAARRPGARLPARLDRRGGAAPCCWPGSGC